MADRVRAAEGGERRVGKGNALGGKLLVHAYQVALALDEQLDDLRFVRLCRGAMGIDAPFLPIRQAPKPARTKSAPSALTVALRNGMLRGFAASNGRARSR